LVFFYFFWWRNKGNFSDFNAFFSIFGFALLFCEQANKNYLNGKKIKSLKIVIFSLRRYSITDKRLKLISYSIRRRCFVFLPSIHKGIKWTCLQSCQIEGKNTKPQQWMKDEISFNFLSLMEYLLSWAIHFSWDLTKLNKAKAGCEVVKFQGPTSINKIHEKYLWTKPPFLSFWSKQIGYFVTSNISSNFSSYWLRMSYWFDFIVMTFKKSSLIIEEMKLKFQCLKFLYFDCR